MRRACSSVHPPVRPRSTPFPFLAIERERECLCCASLSLGQTLLVHGLILAHGDGVIMVWSSPVPQGCVRFEGRACDCERGKGKATHILSDACACLVDLKV